VLHDAECCFEMQNMSSVDKALQILLLLAREPGPLGVREIGRRLGMSAPTVHRLLTTLGMYDLVQHVNGRSEYRLGWACLGLGRAVLNGTEFARAAQDIARALRDGTEETVTGQVHVGGEQVVVVEAEGLHELRRRVGVGRRIPLHAGASGRAILAFLPSEEVERYLAQPLAKIGPNTITDPTELRARLAEVHRLGYATSFEESVTGVGAASVPIFGDDGRVAGSLSVSGPETRIGLDLEQRIVPLLMDAGEALSKALGHRAPEGRGQLVGSVR
jgi:DNA-binding IclR family transcriptional regulator